MKNYFDALYDCMTAGMLKGISLCTQGKSSDAIALLRETLSRAELMHCYLGFLEENARRQEEGKAPLELEEAFSAGDVEEIRRLGW